MKATKNYIKNIQAEPIDEFGPSQLMVSSINSFYRKQDASPFSVKIVTEGVENYYLSGQNYSVRKGEFFIVNENDPITINIDSKEQTKGVCIYPPFDLMQGTLERMTLNTDQILERKTADHHTIFTHKVNRLNNSLTGDLLTSILQNLNHENALTSAESLNLYLQLAEVLVKDQLIINDQLRCLKSKRRTAQEELYRRLSVVKDFIHDNYTEKLEIEQLANLSCLSKFHFLRSFKDLYGLSPYQYAIRLKLEKADTYYIQGYSYAQINEMVGFSDPKNLKRALQKRRRIKV